MKRFTTHITEAQLNEENCSCCDNKIDADGKCGCGPDCEHCGGQHDVDEGSCGTVNASKKTVKEAGLWDNIHAKRKRIKNGSGEKMKKPGSKGAPTDQDFKDASESVELDEAPIKLRGFGPDHKKASGSSLKKIAGAKVAATEEVELDEAPRRKGAPKIKPDFLKVQRAKDAEHNAAMGRTKTGRKKPVRTMTSTQKSLASMRRECAEVLDEKEYDPYAKSTKRAVQHANANQKVAKARNDAVKTSREVKSKRDLAASYEEVQHIQESFKAGGLKLDDGKQVLVKKEDAKMLNDLMKQLSKPNVKKMTDTAMKNKKGYAEILGFARDSHE